tara:strand:+ start:281 stop:637 length:357 start_codon:yes stop_codon:yes gene_type:complete
MAFRLGKEQREFKNSQNTPIFRKKLDAGILGEANKDGSIYISDKIKPGSKKEKEVIQHEKKHADDMASGKLDYSDNHVRYNGKSYHRKDGKINYNGKWLEEGDKSFPWEKTAYKKTKA